MTERAKDQGVTLRRIWQAWCNRCGWRSECSTKWEASMMLGGHNVDRHGGTPRIGGDPE